MELVYVNPEKCIGCLQCELACAVEHSTSRNVASAWAEQPVPRTRIHVVPGPVAGSAYPARCRHCDPAPCVQVCPTGSMARDESHDVVVVDVETCIDCAMCAMVCPFDALTYHPVAASDGERTVAVKCDGCIERLRRGEQPACVEACKVGALVYGDINDLAAQGRLRQSGLVLAAVTAAEAEEDARSGGPVAAWRAWGASAANVVAAAARAEGAAR
ncbi:4Fe-4S dicluster domain-containing protein [Longivirga aurantiaca]|uniref:4Fe-4S dicluster domain-containing protein n=1 Tax=Longivirga aurantiaca TaxID=1837743 RepID=A0ABW1T0C2_9ACTN